MSVGYFNDLILPKLGEKTIWTQCISLHIGTLQRTKLRLISLKQLACYN